MRGRIGPTTFKMRGRCIRTGPVAMLRGQASLVVRQPEVEAMAAKEADTPRVIRVMEK